MHESKVERHIMQVYNCKTLFVHSRMSKQSEVEMRITTVNACRITSAGPAPFPDKACTGKKLIWGKCFGK